VAASADIVAAATDTTHVLGRAILHAEELATAQFQSGGSGTLLKIGSAADDTFDTGWIDRPCAKGAKLNVVIAGGGTESCTIWYYSIVENVAASPTA
jgi:hypothetical protein